MFKKIQMNTCKELKDALFPQLSHQPDVELISHPLSSPGGRLVTTGLDPHTSTLNCMLRLAGSVHSLWFHIIALQLTKLLSFKGIGQHSFRKKSKTIFFFFFEKRDLQL